MKRKGFPTIYETLSFSDHRHLHPSGLRVKPARRVLIYIPLVPFGLDPWVKNNSNMAVDRRHLEDSHGEVFFPFSCQKLCSFRELREDSTFFNLLHTLTRVRERFEDADAGTNFFIWKKIGSFVFVGINGVELRMSTSAKRGGKSAATLISRAKWWGLVDVQKGLYWIIPRFGIYSVLIANIDTVDRQECVIGGITDMVRR